MKHASFLIFLVISWLLVGCQRNPPTVFKSDAPPVGQVAGWTQHTVAEAGFSLSAPDNWRVPTALDMTGILPGGMDASNPDAVREINNDPYSLVPDHGDKSPAVLWLADRNVRAIPGEPRTQFTVQHREVPGGANLEDEAARVKAGLNEYGVRGQETFDLPTGPCHEILTQISLKTTEPVRDLYYVLVDNEDVWTIRFTTMGSGKQLQTTARQILQTFRRAS